ncbi:aldo/keto reductase [Amycolatopsis mediterranei S699]|uniref:Aldo/keto reductase n=2 Tax=Amycolatopsis mediterranei TaxID=33910 RepID=A0A0H3DJE4_AMYMU|nr:aldo/keto reductase [Amycolatopsis mediterranei]ADJ50801.1 aldo/keto reductase [Amycolatopsis mediterranei U32]AEK47811.1 aldo/keto reductase [Amycolatopsis mediterranei S699]AFO82507.1 aldo/keto reductase [Amycolatopsis mediterranei S699]AGT89636.1 aldo/keto reductase [Amycolatopsis mediterranei RB]KDO12206.1 alcohol dehydrogenase [Amycolatopsis mediterranei]
MTKLGNTDLDVYGLNLGCNVFGWTADEPQSFAVLDAYTAAGGNFLDSADLYGGGGGSETIIGNWLAARGRRDDVVVATKVGMWDGRPGLSAKNIQAAAEDSLRRLQTDHIDLYYAHRDDPDTPLEETLEAFDALVRAGKVRYVGASNYTAGRLADALSISDKNGFARFAVLQPHYNLVERDYERDLAPLVEREGLATLPYFALAMGFLTGKYRTKDETGDSPRAARALSYLDKGGDRVLAALDEVAQAHGVSVATVSLAWLRQQPTVAAPIASARTPEQLTDLIASVSLELTDAEVTALNEA